MIAVYLRGCLCPLPAIGHIGQSATIVLTCMDALMPRAQATDRARMVPTILLHFRHPWRSDVGRYDCREGGGRVAPGAATESNAGAVAETCRRRATHDSMARIVPDNPFAFPPSMAVRWRTTAGMQEVEQRRERLPR